MSLTLSCKLLEVFAMICAFCYKIKPKLPICYGVTVVDYNHGKAFEMCQSIVLSGSI